MTSCRLVCNYSYTVTLHGGPVRLRPVRTTPCFSKFTGDILCLHVSLSCSCVSTVVKYTDMLCCMLESHQLGTYCIASRNVSQQNVLWGDFTQDDEYFMRTTDSFLRRERFCPVVIRCSRGLQGDYIIL